MVMMRTRALINSGLENNFCQIKTAEHVYSQKGENTEKAQDAVMFQHVAEAVAENIKDRQAVRHGQLLTYRKTISSS